MYTESVDFHIIDSLAYMALLSHPVATLNAKLNAAKQEGNLQQFSMVVSHCTLTAVYFILKALWDGTASSRWFLKLYL